MVVYGALLSNVPAQNHQVVMAVTFVQQSPCVPKRQQSNQLKDCKKIRPPPNVLEFNGSLSGILNITERKVDFFNLFSYKVNNNYCFLSHTEKGRSDKYKKLNLRILET